jgi:hypothetical protein
VQTVQPLPGDNEPHPSGVQTVKRAKNYPGVKGSHYQSRSWLGLQYHNRTGAIKIQGHCIKGSDTVVSSIRPMHFSVFLISSPGESEAEPGLEAQQKYAKSKARR